MRSRVGLGVDQPRRRGWGRGVELTPLGHPAWWFALGVLLVNDNLLKGGGWCPGWLTGKLSDFAFLVVAPVLLTTLLPRRWEARRAFAFVVVVGGFVATDLSSRASDLVVALAGAFGLRWKLWPDPTDLVALVVLPGSWWIAGRHTSLRVRGGRRLRQLAGVFVGALACMATADNSEMRYPFFVNQTVASQAVTFTWLFRREACEVDLTGLAATLTADDLADPHTETIDSGRIAALDTMPGPQTWLGGNCRNALLSSSGDDCAQAIVAIAGGPAALFSARRRWVATPEGDSWFSCNDSSVASRCAPTMSITRTAGPDALVVRARNGGLAFEAGENLGAIEVNAAQILARPGDGTGCRSQLRQLTALVAGATSCMADADCQVLEVGFTTIDPPVCNVYVNRSLSPLTIGQWWTGWRQRCRADRVGYCGAGPVQPPVCRGGRCQEACPGESIPVCSPTCDGFATPGGPCEGMAPLFCYAPDGRYCVCGGSPAVMNCGPGPALSATCPVGCTTYRALAPARAFEPLPDASLVPVDTSAAFDATTVDTD